MDHVINDNREIRMFDPEATGKRIGELIDASGFCDKDIAEQLGLSVQAINKWRHARSFPDIGNLFLLKQLLGVRIDDFFQP